MRVSRPSAMLLVASVHGAIAFQAATAASLLPPPSAAAAPTSFLDTRDRALLASSGIDNTLLWSQLPAFYDSSDPAAAPIRGCTGALVAPRFVLTTAACATQHRIAAVSFTQGSSSSSAAATLSRAVAASVVHPRFEVAGPSRYNVALLEFAAPVPFVTLALDFAPALADEQFVRVSSWDNQVTSASVASLAVCAGDSGLVPVPSDATDGSLVCLGSTVTSQFQTGSSIVVYKAASTALLSGFELPRETGASRVFISMRGVANFINAVAEDLHTGTICIITNFDTNDALAKHDSSDADASEHIDSITRAKHDSSDADANEHIDSITRAKHDSSDADANEVSQSNAAVDTSTTSNTNDPEHDYHPDRGGKSFCGGTLVGPYHVLTAAHCVADGVVNWVALGSGTGALEEIPVSRVTIHPRYNPESMLYDAAVLELANFARSARWVKLDAAHDHPDHTVARMVSGVTTSAAFVNALWLPIWARAKCEAQYPVVSTPVLCAGGSAGVDACAGNSGSPLVLSSNSDVDVLVGIVSAGFGCGTRGTPGFYTRIASVIDFVTQFTIPAVPDPTAPALETPTAAPRINSAPSPPTLSPSHISSGGGQITHTPVAALGGAATPYPSGIRSASLDPDVTLIAKAKALVFLAGEYENALVSRSLWAKIVDPTNSVVLYSTGNLEGVLSVIKRRSTLPLNQRSDRFKTVKDHQRPSASVLHCSAA